MNPCREDPVSPIYGQWLYSRLFISLINTAILGHKGRVSTNFAFHFYQQE